MADLLIFAQAGGRADGYQKGDIVEVRESGAPRGRLEGPPRFVWIEVADAKAADIAGRVEDVRETSQRRVGRLVARRRYRLSDADVDAALRDGGRLVLSAAQLGVRVEDKRPSVRDRVDG